MKHTPSRALRGAALVLALGLLPVAGAWAAQSITVSTDVAHYVCGNGNAADNGNWPCNQPPVGNTVTINSGVTVTGYVYGALNNIDATSVTGNRVDVKGTVTEAVYGGYHVRNGTSDNVTASNNTVTIVPGSVVALGVRCGYAYTGSGNATASGNTVEISGGTITGSITGGAASSTAGGTMTATNNTVTIKGTPTFTGVGQLTGGNISSGGTSTGNTLNLHTAGLTVSALTRFQNLNFYLPTGLAPGGNMLNVTGAAQLGTNAAVTVNLEGAGPALHTGDTFNLISAGGGVDGSIASTSASGVLKGYNYTLKVDGENLVLTIGNPVPAATGAATVPTLGEYALAALGLLLAALAFFTLRRKA